MNVDYHSRHLLHKRTPYHYASVQLAERNNDKLRQGINSTYTLHVPLIYSFDGEHV